MKLNRFLETKTHTEAQRATELCNDDSTARAELALEQALVQALGELRKMMRQNHIEYDEKACLARLLEELILEQIPARTRK